MNLFLVIRDQEWDLNNTRPEIKLAVKQIIQKWGNDMNVAPKDITYKANLIAQQWGTPHPS